jgi:two-component system, sensor histidine kinase and response regulator
MKLPSSSAITMATMRAAWINGWPVLASLCACVVTCAGLVLWSVHSHDAFLEQHAREQANLAQSIEVDVTAQIAATAQSAKTVVDLSRLDLARKLQARFDVATSSQLQIAITAQDGTLLAAHPDLSIPVGSTLTGSMLKGVGLRGEPVVGIARTAPNALFTVFVESARHELLAQWIRATLPTTALSLGATIALILLTLAIFAAGVTTRQLYRSLRSTRQSLREAEHRSRAMLESAPNAIVSVDANDRIVGWNRAAELTFGWSAREVLGRSAMETLVPEATRPMLREMFVRFASSGTQTHLGERIETILMRAGSGELPVEVVLSHFRVRGGVVFMMQIHEISGQREIESQLRANERRHRVVVDGLREIIFQADRSGLVTYLNLAWRRATRHAIEESLGRPLSEFAVESDRAELAKLFESLPLNTANIVPVDPVEVRFRTAEGSERLLFVTAQPLADADGQVVGAVGTLEDITEKRAAELRLREQLRFNRELLEAIPIPVAVRNQKTQFVAVNRAWEQFTGDDRADILGQTVARVLPAEVAEATSKMERELIASGGSETTEEVFLANDGTRRSVISYKSAFVREDGSASGLISAFVDITDQKSAEVAVRIAKDAAEAANRAKNEFLANISHELRTPLNGIIGMTGLALASPLDPETHEYLAVVKASADTVLYIIDDMLDLARIEAGQLQIERAELDLRKLVGEVSRMLGPQASQNGVELILSVGRDVPERILGDPHRLRQVLTNLVGNAIKFTLAGEIELRVARNADAQIEFGVRDTGPGLPHSVIDALNSDVDGPLERNNSALGLQIAQRLIKMMGGDRLVADPTYTAGAALHFVLPASGGSERTLTPISGIALIVSSHASVGATLERLLRDRGADVVVVASGAAAIDAMQLGGRPIGMAFVDANLQSEDGAAVAQSLLRTDPLLRVALLAPMAGEHSDVAAAADRVALRYLRKPILEAELDQLLTVQTIPTPTALPDARQSLPTLVQPPTADLLAGAAILVAEDHVVNQTLVRRLLERAGHQVSIVADGNTAVEAVGQARFDLILMDIQMPVLDGLEATRRIRAIEATSSGGHRIPIIALTAHAFGSDRELCLEAGMDGFLTKPINAAALAQVLQEHLPKLKTSTSEEV